MSDRIDELKANVKKGVGAVTGNKRLKAEGDGQSENARAKRKTNGAVRQAGGAVKQGFGKLTGDEGTQAEGAAETLRGKAERTG